MEVWFLKGFHQKIKAIQKEAESIILPILLIILIPISLSIPPFPKH